MLLILCHINPLNILTPSLLIEAPFYGCSRVCDHVKCFSSSDILYLFLLDGFMLFKYGQEHILGRGIMGYKTIPVAERSRARVCGRSLSGIVGTNTAGVMDVCLF